MSFVCRQQFDLVMSVIVIDNATPPSLSLTTGGHLSVLVQLAADADDGPEALVDVDGPAEVVLAVRLPYLASSFGSLSTSHSFSFRIFVQHCTFAKKIQIQSSNNR